MAVHAHPDDEAIATGGMLARFAAAGIRTAVVTCTSGHIGAPRSVGLDHLANVRREELAAALRILDVHRSISLGYDDSGMSGSAENANPACFVQAPLAEAAQRLAELLREEQPDVVVTYDHDGGYGHPDHVKAHQITLAAVDLVPELGAALYAVVWPRSWLRHFVELMAAAGLSVDSPTLLGVDDVQPSDGFGTPDALVTDTVDVAAFAHVKARAIAAHRSQMGLDHPLVSMPMAVRDEIFGKEFFRRLR